MTKDVRWKLDKKKRIEMEKQESNVNKGIKTGGVIVENRVK